MRSGLHRCTLIDPRPQKLSKSQRRWLHTFRESKPASAAGAGTAIADSSASTAGADTPITESPTSAAGVETDTADSSAAIPSSGASTAPSALPTHNAASSAATADLPMFRVTAMTPDADATALPDTKAAGAHTFTDGHEGVQSAAQVHPTSETSACQQHAVSDTLQFTLSALQSVLARPQSNIDELQPATAELQPATTEPQLATAELQPATAEPQLATADLLHERCNVASAPRHQDVGANIVRPDTKQCSHEGLQGTLSHQIQVICLTFLSS